MAVKAAEVDLLCMQTCQSLAYLRVCAHVFSEDWVNNLLRLAIRALTSRHTIRIVAIFAPIIR